MQSLLDMRLSALESIETAVPTKQRSANMEHTEKPLKSFVIVNNFGKKSRFKQEKPCDLEKKLANLNLKERGEYLKTNRLCFNCLSGSHMSRNCPQNSMCFK